MFPNEQVGTGEKLLNEYSAFLSDHHTALNNVILKTPFIIKDHNDEEVKNILRNADKDTLRQQKSASIRINFSCAEDGIATMDLIQSDNKCLNKTVAVFAQLCIEVRELCKEGNQHLTNCLFASEELREISENNEKNDQTYIEIFSMDNKQKRADAVPLSINIVKKMNSYLGLFFRTQQFIERCFVVISEIIKQLTALFDADKSNHINVDYSSLHFQTVFNYLAEAVGLIIKCDSVFQTSQLQNIWSQYVTAIIGNSQLSHNDITGFENLLSKIGHLLTGHLFQNLLDSICHQAKFQLSTQALPQFSVQFQSFLRNNLNVLQKNINMTLGQSRNTFNLYLGNAQTITDNDADETLLTLIEETALDLAMPIVKMNSMCILYHHLFGNLDRKLFAAVIDTNKKLPYIKLIENVIWSPEAFLGEFGSTLLIKFRGGAEKVSVHDLQHTQKQWLQSKCQRLSKDVQLYINQVAIWILNFRNEFDCSGVLKTGHMQSNLNFIKTTDLYRRTLLILQGIDLADKFSNAVNAITNLHVHIKYPITKQSILHVCKLTELLKLIKLTMEKYATEIYHTTLYLSQHQLYQALHIISTVKKQFQSTSSMGSVYNERTVDILSALELSQLSLIGSPNIRRILLARLALTMADPKQLFQADQLNKICRLFVSIERLIDLSDTLQTLSSQSYIYWHHDVIIPIYLRDVIQVNDTDDCENIQYLFESIVDYYSDLMGRSVQFQNDQRIEKLSRSIDPILNELIVSKFCGVIETKLRLDVHENLQLLQTESMSLSEACNSNLAIPIRGANRILSLKMVQLFRMADMKNVHLPQYWSVRDRVRKYLSHMFYNLTTISMHDWRTYGQMRILAKQKFNLETVEDHLPTQTIEQGLDVLEIMRNIHLFVTNYVYNLNNQIFIQKNSKNKHLNTINIRHIANSLRTHGIGIINTTVNFVYQFLHKKFYTFSQFLHNEHIQSRLLKDYKSYYDANSGRAEDQQIYSFERANNLNKGIRQLGLSKNGLSPLDLFRELITHIGNTMAYVRMIRSGGIHCCSNASVFLAVTDIKLLFEKLCIRFDLSDTTRRSALNIENEVKHLHHNYAESTEYFRMLVEAFSSFFQNNRNPHIKLFYLIAPALILNYIEYIVAVKDSVNKKTKDFGCFTDDGFAMGLTYVLFLLNQNTEFQSLHWFEAVRQKFSQELEQLAKAREENNYSPTEDKKLQQTLALSEKRINIFLHEFDLLRCSLNSAKVFFQ